MTRGEGEGKYNTGEGRGLIKVNINEAKELTTLAQVALKYRRLVILDEVGEICTGWVVMRASTRSNRGE